MIAYPVRAANDGTARILDGNDRVLGTLQIVEALDAMHSLLGRLKHRYHVAGEPLWDEVAALLGHGHWSDCAVYNEPASPAGPCDCGGYP